MTLATATPSNLPAVPTDDFGMAGLEDIDASDLTIPRIKIAHKVAKFEDSLSNEQFDTLDVVMLGLMKQRILWDPEVEDDSEPLCKSFDHEVGYADPVNFPWKASSFDRASFDPERPALPCSGCPLKEWDSHPSRPVPWCNEQFTFALLMADAEGDYSAPALLTVQKTGVKPAKAYATSFVRAKKPMFTAVTRLGLTAQKRGQTDYAVPTFTKIGDTEPGEGNAIWTGYAQQFYSVREFVTTPRVDNGTTGDNTAATANTAPPASTGAQAAPTARDESDIPF